jgi:fused signal recognition particle receptor
MLGFLRQRGKEKTARAVEKTSRTWFGRITSLFRDARLDDDLWDELEELLISADMGVGTTQKLLKRLRERVRQENVTRPEDALDLLKQEMVAILRADRPAAPDASRDGGLLAVLMVGVNGAGKTTSIAKLVKLYQEDGRKVLLGAADTFRAAAIDQLQAWGARLEVDVIAHRPGADPGAVAFDTLRAARARNTDVVIIDTAGRLHTKVNLMEEIKKIQRVISRQENRASQMVMLTLDATAGQNGLFQARAFTEALQCDGIFLAKLDGTAKGGVVLAIADELRLPVLYVGTGEQPDDIAAFDPAEFVDALFGAEELGQAR